MLWRYAPERECEVPVVVRADSSSRRTFWRPRSHSVEVRRPPGRQRRRWWCGGGCGGGGAAAVVVVVVVVVECSTSRRGGATQQIRQLLRLPAQQQTNTTNINNKRKNNNNDDDDEDDTNNSNSNIDNKPQQTGTATQLVGWCQWKRSSLGVAQGRRATDLAGTVFCMARRQNSASSLCQCAPQGSASNLAARSCCDHVKCVARWRTAERSVLGVVLAAQTQHTPPPPRPLTVAAARPPVVVSMRG